MAARPKIEKVRASRDGHEFHETWTARKAMQLLWPDSNLKALAVEGLSPVDQVRASASSVEVADVTLYYGDQPTFMQAKSTIFAQFKYSIANQEKDFRAADAKKTIKKFAQTYRDYQKSYGNLAVAEKLEFQLITNQPISTSLLQAIEAIATSKKCAGDIKNQATQLRTATGLTGIPLTLFAQKLKIIGRSGSLPSLKNELASLIVDWSATGCDANAAARLGNLKSLVREKAGYVGTNRNLIQRTDILSALQIGDHEDLLPCKSALVDVGEKVEREQIPEALLRIACLSKPLLIHAAGGVGKTVFLDSLAGKLGAEHEVVFFDCFGGGAYRSPEDARHLPKRGLIHIANTLAFRGLCDPILPDSHDLQTLLNTFRRRLAQCIATLSRVTPGRNLILFIDAIDNAEFAARRGSQDCFPIKLLESLDFESIDGVKLIVSCRTERKPKTYAMYEELQLQPFTKEETTRLLKTRLKNITHAEINVAQARSGGNPRVLDYLISAGRGLFDPSEINKEIALDDLIQQRITDALRAVLERGNEEEDVNAFLAGLAVLPPPVPLDEYAGAHGLDISAIESFASDLSPLLERTSNGLMFRDEPTETFIHSRYAKSRGALQRVAGNLFARQETSVYAARSLPGLLHELDDSDRLFALAFDKRIPSSITSTVGKRSVQYARLKAATLHGALKKDHNKLVQLLLELSTIAAIDQRGADYILGHPDLVVAARDSDARRRLFEIRTTWPGTRHARLAIAHTLSGEFEEATRHANTSFEWIEHYLRMDLGTRPHSTGPEQADIAAVPFFLISQGRGSDAARYFKHWQAWYAYRVCDYVFMFTHLAQKIREEPPSRLRGFVSALSNIGPLASALSFECLPKSRRKEIVTKLAKSCKTSAKLYFPPHYGPHNGIDLEDGLRRACVIAMSLGLEQDALKISRQIRHERPGISAYQNIFQIRDVLAFIFQTALDAAIKKRPIYEKDVLSKELVPICAHLPKTLTGKPFRVRAKKKLSNVPRKPRDKDETIKQTNSLSYEERENVERFLDIRLEPVLSLTSALSTALSATARSADRLFLELVETWENVRQNRDRYRLEGIDQFFHFLGFEVLLLVLGARTELKPDSIRRFLEVARTHDLGVSSLVRIISILAKRSPLQILAGEEAIRARALIERENEVNLRATLFGALGRAMLPASLEEATSYFRSGLEQMDAIGSGDYQFTNELLLFASQIKGDELSDRDIHTLTNICELNMGEEPEKFPWGAYGRGLAKVAGLRGLAKLSRWDDRSKISLSNTLLPYIIGLVEAGKIGATDALGLNRLANPVEYYYSGTKEFAEALRKQFGPDPLAISELIDQFEDDNPNRAGDDTISTLYSIAKETFGTSHEICRHLELIRNYYADGRDGRRRRFNHSSETDINVQMGLAERENQDELELVRIAEATDPLNRASLENAITGFNALENRHALKAKFFTALRSKVPFSRRGQYVRNIATLENLFFYWKFDELKAAKDAWFGSSVALSDVYRDLAIPLIQAHADNLIEHGQLSSSSIKEISNFTGVPEAELVLECIKEFSRQDRDVDGSVWLALASFILPEADEGQGQIGLNRLLSSEAARMADTVVDGPWVAGLYPRNDVDEIAAGLIWRELGSPRSVDRWRGTHSMRAFARLGRWKVIDSVVHLSKAKTANAFSAPELPFYFLHARLWLYIALARMALDHSDQIGRYKVELLAAATKGDDPHVLIQHFAAMALRSCSELGNLTLPTSTLKQLGNVAKSPFPRLRKKVRNGGGFYHGRPKEGSEPPFQFHLDYDFHKYDVDNLSQVFGMGCWEVEDMISDTVHKLDPAVKSMYETGGREIHRSDRLGMTSEFHSHGQQLGWHALFIVAAKLLASRRVTDDWWYEDDPWEEWFSRYGLTRRDGLWLSDGTDKSPIDTAVFLLEQRGKELIVTGDQEKLMQLAGISAGHIGNELVIEGRWFSADQVRIEISSALVTSAEAARNACKLAREEPMTAWIPVFNGTEGDTNHTDGMTDYTPWLVIPSGEARLDKHDPYGVAGANTRPRLSSDCIDLCKLTKSDPFGREWQNNRGVISTRVQVWGRDEGEREEGVLPGMRVICHTPVLEKVLRTFDKDLLLLINLQLYEKNYHSGGKYTNTTAVIRIGQSLDIEYFPGHINHLHKTPY